MGYCGAYHSKTKRPQEIQRLETLASALDTSFTVPLLRVKLGWDGLIGLIPGVGDIAGAVLGAYVLLRAIQLGARKRTILEMLFHLAADALIGVIPVIGDLADVFNKAHARNVRLLLTEYEQGHLTRLAP